MDNAAPTSIDGIHESIRESIVKRQIEKAIEAVKAFSTASKKDSGGP